MDSVVEIYQIFLDELKKMKDIYPSAQVYFLGHNHELKANFTKSMVINKQGEEQEAIKWYVRGGSFLGYDNYAREKHLLPSVTGCVIMKTNGFLL